MYIDTQLYSSIRLSARLPIIVYGLGNCAPTKMKHKLTEGKRHRVFLPVFLCAYT